MRTVKQIVEEEVICSIYSLIEALMVLLPESIEYQTEYEQLLEFSTNTKYIASDHNYYFDEDGQDLYKVICEKPNNFIEHEPVYLVEKEELPELEAQVDAYTELRELVLEKYLTSIGLDYRTTNWTFLESEEEPEFEEEEIEILEYWIVTRWLANKLIENGEAVIKDFFGMDIWGRSESGQAIYIDYVIQKIHSDIQI